MITLDEINLYQLKPPFQPPQSFPPITQAPKFPALNHPLPPKPQSQNAAYPDLSHSQEPQCHLLTRPHANIFDSELAAWNKLTALQTNTALALENPGQRPPDGDSRDLSSQQSKPCVDIPTRDCQREHSQTTNQSGTSLSDAPLESAEHLPTRFLDQGIRGIVGVSGLDGAHDLQDSTRFPDTNDETSSRTALSLASGGSVHAEDPARRRASTGIPDSVESTSIDTNKATDHIETEHDEAAPLDDLARPGGDYDDKGPSNHTRPTDATPSGRFGERLTPQHCSRQNGTIAVIIPASQPRRSRRRKSPKRTHERRGRKRKQRPASLDGNESDEPDDVDDLDYIEVTKHVDAQPRLVKGPKQHPVATSDRREPATTVPSHLEGFSIPDLHTVSRGRFTCDIYPSQFIYSYSWTHARECLDSAPQHVSDRADVSHEVDAARQPGPLTAPENRRLNGPWSEQEDADLQRLKENGLSWKQIHQHFPQRTEGAIKARYTQKFNKKVPPASVSNPRDDGDLDASLSPPPGRHARYGPPRSRRGVDRYSPA